MANMTKVTEIAMTRGACDGGSMKFGFTPGGGGMAGEELDGPSLNLL